MTKKKKKSDPDNFTDMFSQFGKDLKMPSVDVDAIVAHHRKNLEALEQAVKASAEGASTLMTRQREMLQDTLREIADMAHGFKSPGNPRDLLAKQADFAKKSFEAAVRNAGEAAEVVKKSGTESIEILRERIRGAMEEIREGYDKKK